MTGQSPKRPDPHAIRGTLDEFRYAVGPAGVHVVFQPIVDLGTREVFAHETLARCRTPGFESPARLFEDAVAKGYCGRLGREIREKMIAANPGVPLFANVHPEELVQRFITLPDDPIFGYAQPIYLEITEAVPFSHFDHCRAVLEEIKTRAGIFLVIDDLGAGYSNLLRIVDLEPSIVKLDMQLVRGIDRRQRQQRLVRSIIAMCEEQGAKVVAEGIETVDELNAVIDCGAHYGQGYLLARPGFPPPAAIWPAGGR